jgi:fumarate hydratase subunit alpha
MLGIGPMGVGGKTTAFAVNVEVAPCCAALERPATNGHGFGWIPASVLVNCWPSRYGKARIYEDGLVEYL